MALGLNMIEAVGLVDSCRYFPTQRKGGILTAVPYDAVKGARSAFIIGTTLCLLQALDGILTSVGMRRFGTEFEGNPLLRSLMEQFGHVPTLGLVKLLSIFFVIALTIYAQKQPWVRNAMGAISCIYLFAAILPWTYFLFIK